MNCRREPKPSRDLRNPNKTPSNGSKSAKRKEERYLMNTTSAGNQIPTTCMELKKSTNQGTKKVFATTEIDEAEDAATSQSRKETGLSPRSAKTSLLRTFPRLLFSFHFVSSLSLKKERGRRILHDCGEIRKRTGFKMKKI